VEPGIVLLLPSFGAGGAERVVINLANAFASTGRRTDVLVLDGRGPMRQHLDAAVHVTDLGRPRARSAGPSIVRAVRRLRPDVLVASQTHLNLLVAGLRPLLPRDLRLVLREPLLAPPSGTRTLEDRAVGRLHRRAALVVASSEPMRHHLDRTVDGRVRVAHVPNPVDVDRLRTGIVPARAPGAGRRLVTVGRLVPEKGHADLLRALAAGAAPDDRLEVVGAGPLRGALEALAAELGVTERITFHGHLDAPGPVVAGADLLVQAAHVEGMPNAVLEALALGTPVLATTDLVALEGLAAELGPAALRLVARAELASALAGPSGDGVEGGGEAGSGEDLPTLRGLRPSLLPDRFRADTVAARLLELLDEPSRRAGA